MTMTGLRVFDETLHTTQTWLHELESRLALDDRQAAYRVLRAGLHTLRDALEVIESAHLSAQLPMLIRGIYFEGWRPSATPHRFRDREEFLAAMKKALGPRSDIPPEAAMGQLVEVMRMHVSEGEMEDVRRCVPEAYRDLLKPA